MSLIITLVRTESPPAPTPWMARPARSMPRFSARAQIRLPTMKTMLALSRMGFLPKMSLVFPHMGPAADTAMMKEEPIQA